MFLLALIVALVLAYWSVVDWREHEIEDGQTIGFLAAAALVSVSMSLLQNNFAQIGVSLATGGLFALFGYVLYRVDWWGGADVKIIAGLGFLANPLVLSVPGIMVWPFMEIAFFVNLCLCSIVFFGLAEGYYWLKKKKIEKEVPYVPAFLLAWLATIAFGDLLTGLLVALGH